VFNLTEPLHQVFDSEHPDLICVELDQQRYQALVMRQQEQAQVKKPVRNVPLIYRVLARFQESMADQYGVIPGNEMLAAITYAQNHQLPVELIDMNAQHLFTTMWKSMTLRERFRLFLTGFRGLFIGKQRVEEELKNYQADVTGYLDEIGKIFPTIKHTLIDRRNEHMVKRLQILQQKYETVAACVGDGHLPGMEELLEQYKIDYKSIHLDELQKKHSEPSVSSAGFSITVNSSFPSIENKK